MGFIWFYVGRREKPSHELAMFVEQLPPTAELSVLLANLMSPLVMISSSSTIVRSRRRTVFIPDSGHFLHAFLHFQIFHTPLLHYFEQFGTVNPHVVIWGRTAAMRLLGAIENGIVISQRISVQGSRNPSS
jgi:hypothetical protein